MKLYMHPVSTASRPVRLFIAEKKIQCDEEFVDLLAGAHYREPYASLNPNKLVPWLQDGDLRLTESSAILKYLASKHDLPEYPKGRKTRARVNEAMDWFNTQFFRDYGYGLIYPQIYPHHRRPNETFQSGVIAWGKERAEGWFRLLDSHWIGTNEYVVGDDITIADYFGSCVVTMGEMIGCQWTRFPNVTRWIDNVKKLGSWGRINEAMVGFADSMKDQKFEVL